MQLTDEQIEKALYCCQWAQKKCSECPLDPKTPCVTNLHLATLKYIERLKGATVPTFNDFIEQMRKKVAKEILKIIEEEKNGKNGWLYCNSDFAIVHKIKEKYGVEEDE